MKRLLLFILFPLILSLLLMSCGSSPKAPSPVLMVTFTGTGDIITEQFFLQGDYGSWDFTVSWQCTPKYAEAFGVFVHLITINNPILASSPRNQSEGSMEVHYFEDVPSGEAPFIIEIIAAHSCSWAIEIWQ